MPEPSEIRQELRDEVERITQTEPDAVLALRALHALYFASKPTATIPERGFLLGQGAAFSLSQKIPYSVDKEIFAEEAEKHKQDQATTETTE